MSMTFIFKEFDNVFESLVRAASMPTKHGFTKDTRYMEYARLFSEWLYGTVERTISFLYHTPSVELSDGFL